MSEQQAAGLRTAAAALIDVLEPIDAERWNRVPGPGVWSIGKEVEHVAEAAVYHQWIVRRTIGERVSSRRPTIERKQLTSALSPREGIDLIRRQTDDGVALLLALTDAQLAIPTRPPRARGHRLGETIDSVLIGHYDAHRVEIEAKLHADEFPSEELSGEA